MRDFGTGFVSDCSYVALVESMGKAGPVKRRHRRAGAGAIRVRFGAKSGMGLGFGELWPAAPPRGPRRAGGGGLGLELTRQGTMHALALASRSRPRGRGPGSAARRRFFHLCMRA